MMIELSTSNLTPNALPTKLAMLESGLAPGPQTRSSQWRRPIPTDPIGRRTSREVEQERRVLEYFKGTAQAPMGWPSEPPTSTYIDPADIERMLNATPEGRRGNPWLNLRNVIVVAISFGFLIGVIALLLR